MVKRNPEPIPFSVMLLLPSHVLSDFTSKMYYGVSKINLLPVCCEKRMRMDIGVLGIGHRPLEILAGVCQGCNLRSDRVLELEIYRYKLYL